MNVTKWMLLFLWMLLAVLFVLPNSVQAQRQDVLSPQFVMQNLKKGVTTREDVLRLFGEPTQQDVRVSSESGSLETFVYTKDTNAVLRKQKSSGGFKAFLRTARGVAGDVAAITGKGYGGEVDRALRQAEHAANAADRISSGADAGQVSSTSVVGRSLTLTIRLANGVVTGYEMN